MASGYFRVVVCLHISHYIYQRACHWHSRSTFYWSFVILADSENIDTFDISISSLHSWYVVRISMKIGLFLSAKRTWSCNDYCTDSSTMKLLERIIGFAGLDGDDDSYCWRLLDLCWLDGSDIYQPHVIVIEVIYHRYQANRLVGESNKTWKRKGGYYVNSIREIYFTHSRIFASHYKSWTRQLWG